MASELSTRQFENLYNSLQIQGRKMDAVADKIKKLGAEEDKTQGWKKNPGAKRFHYFVDSRSLCGTHVYLGEVFENSPDPTDCCKDCFSYYVRKQARGYSWKEVRALYKV